MRNNFHYSSKMIGCFPRVLNWTGFSSNSTGPYVINYLFSLLIGLHCCTHTILWWHHGPFFVIAFKIFTIGFPFNGWPPCLKSSSLSTQVGMDYWTYGHINFGRRGKVCFQLRRISQFHIWMPFFLLGHLNTLLEAFSSSTRHLPLSNFLLQSNILT